MFYAAQKLSYPQAILTMTVTSYALSGSAAEHNARDLAESAEYRQPKSIPQNLEPICHWDGAAEGPLAVSRKPIVG
jgi:hypothetical protein